MCKRKIGKVGTVGKYGNSIGKQEDHFSKAPYNPMSYHIYRENKDENEQSIHVKDSGNIKDQSIPYSGKKLPKSNSMKVVFVKKEENNTAIDVTKQY